MRRIAFIAILLPAIISQASAQAFNAFTAGTLTGVNVSHVGLDYTVSLSPGATVNGMEIEELFGFWALSSDNMGASGADQSDWKWKPSDGPGGGYADGWDDNSKKNDLNLDKGSPLSVTLDFGALDSSKIQNFGFHLIWVKGHNADGELTDTGFWKGAAVPEPMSFAPLGLGALVLIRRKRNTSR